MTDDRKKTRKQLIDELLLLRARLSAMEQMQDGTKLAQGAYDDVEAECSGFFKYGSVAVVLILDSRCIYVNPPFTKLTGYTIGDLSSLGSLDIISSEMGGLIRSRCAASSEEEGASSRCDLKFITKTGEERYGNFGIAPASFCGSQAWLASLIDVTDQRRMEKTLKESEERYRSIFENTMVGVYRSLPSGHYLLVNEAFAHIFGYDSSAELISSVKDIQSQLYDDPRDGEECIRLLREEGVHNFEVQIRRKNGSMGWISNHVRMVQDECNNITGFEGVVVDITERKHAEQSLQESENKFRILAEKSFVGIYLIQDGVFRYVNSKFAEICGYPAEEIIDRMRPEDIVIPEDRLKLKENMRRRFKGELESLHYDFRVCTKNQETKNVDSFTARIIYKEKPAIIGTLLDITERKQAEDERERLILEIQDALAKVKTLSGMLPICSACKKIRNDEGYWEQIETYIRERSEADFSHGICPDCLKRLYPEFCGDE